MKERGVKRNGAVAPADRQAIRSVVVGASLLTALARHDGPAPLSSLAESAGMPAAKAHRYLAGYIRAGFAQQDAATGRYLLGPLALEIGLAAIRRLDVVTAAEAELAALRDAVEETISLTVWGNRGPTVVRWLEGPQPVSLTMLLGAVLPVTLSANGLVFAAFLPADVTTPLVEAEIARATSSAAERRRRGAAFARALEAVRAHRLGVSENLVQPGISSLAAPICAYPGSVVASIALVGLHGVIDVSLRGAPARALSATAARISARLGAP